MQFQNDIFAEAEFTIESELPNTGEATLPDLSFPDAQRAAGYVIVDNASDSEMQTTSAGADPVQPGFQASQFTRNAKIFRVQPEWSVKVSITSPRKAAARTAFA